jgi:hypothetical protein
VPSEKVPIAVNCSVVPRAILGLVGDTLIETSVAGVTVSVLEAIMFVAGSTALIVACPVLFDTTRPLALTVAATEEEAHITDAVMS